MHVSESSHWVKVVYWLENAFLHITNLSPPNSWLLRPVLGDDDRQERSD